MRSLLLLCVTGIWILSLLAYQNNHGKPIIQGIATLLCIGAALSITLILPLTDSTRKPVRVYYQRRRQLWPLMISLLAALLIISAVTLAFYVRITSQ